MKMNSVFAMAVATCLLPALAQAQEKRVTCSDNTVVTTDRACDNHGGVQKPGGLNRVGKQLNKAALDVKDEAKRTPGNVESGAKSVGHNVSEAAGDVGNGVKKTAKKARHGAGEAAGDVSKGTQHTAKKLRHGAGEAAGDVSKGAQKAVHPKTYKANCTDGTTWTGRDKSDACKNHGSVSNWP
jgi:hypothetical protein